MRLNVKDAYRIIKPILIVGVLLSMLASLILHVSQGKHRADEDNIREVVFRYQFEHNYSGLQKKADAYYLSLEDYGNTPADSDTILGRLMVLAKSFGKSKEPSQTFVLRFQGHNPPVKRLSECIVDGEGVKNPKTGRRGLIFTIGNIKWINDNEVEVTGGYYEGGMSSSGVTYKVQRKNSKWKVISEKLNWIS